jgi:hypothetical protein
MAGAPNQNGMNGTNGFYPTQQNGIPSQQQNGAGGVIMPSAGHYADMQMLMSSMETLSGWLQQNREEWAGLQEGLARVERAQQDRGADFLGGVLGNGHGMVGQNAAAGDLATNGEILRMHDLHQFLAVLLRCSLHLCREQECGSMC